MSYATPVDFHDLFHVAYLTSNEISLALIRLRLPISCLELATCRVTLALSSGAYC